MPIITSFQASMAWLCHMISHDIAASKTCNISDFASTAVCSIIFSNELSKSTGKKKGGGGKITIRCNLQTAIVMFSIINSRKHFDSIDNREKYALSSFFR